MRGTDPALRDEYVVLGAHFDHLGRSIMGALDPEASNAIHNGADDNASGTAAVIELGAPAATESAEAVGDRRHVQRRGAWAFSDRSTSPTTCPCRSRRCARCSTSTWSVGCSDNRMIVYGVATAQELPDIVNRANAVTPLQLTATGDGFGASDHSSFYAKNLPVLHFFTNVHDDYHKASDDADKVNAAGTA